jgi:hypothetical protein
MSADVTTTVTRIDAYLAREAARGRAPRPDALAAALRPLRPRQQRMVLHWLTEHHPALAADVAPRLQGPACPTANTYTTAPEDYDGFGSATLGVVGTLAGQPIRQVATPVAHLTWQRNRYGSGLYPAYTLTEFLDLIRHPWAQYVPAPSTLA